MENDNWELLNHSEYDEKPNIILMDKFQFKEKYLEENEIKENKSIQKLLEENKEDLEKQIEMNKKDLEKKIELNQKEFKKENECLKNEFLKDEVLRNEIFKDYGSSFLENEKQKQKELKKKKKKKKKKKEIMKVQGEDSIINFIMNNPTPIEHFDLMYY